MRPLYTCLFMGLLLAIGAVGCGSSSDGKPDVTHGAKAGQAAVGDVGQTSKWATFSPADKLFRVSFPGVPRTSEKVQRGRTVIDHRSDTSAYTCAVGQISGKDEMDDPLVASISLMSMAESESIRRKNATILGYTPLTHKGYPGIEVEIAAGNQHNTCRFIMCGRNIWALEFSELQNQKRPEEKKQFFDSFELIVAPKTTPSGAVATGPATQMGPAPRRPVGAFSQRRAACPTVLLKQVPAPQPERTVEVPDGVQEVTYESGESQLKAWLMVPATSDSTVKVPSLVFLHDGVSLTPAAVSECQRFADAGFAVLLPMFRGESGNSGNFELMWGEVDDARAAIRWLSKQSFVDPERIHAFGDGTGGGIAALLSLYGDIPLRDSGSVNGLFTEASLLQFHEIAPFDLADVYERRHRLLLGNTREMVCPHYAFIGKNHPLREVLPHARLNSGTFLLGVAPVPGDATTSLAPAMERYLAQCQADNGPQPDGDEPSTVGAPGQGAKNQGLSSILGAIGQGSQSLKQLRLMAEVIEKTSADAINPRQQYVVAAETWLSAKDTIRAYRVARLAEVTAPGNSFLPVDDTDLRIAEVYARTGQEKLAAPLIERLIQATDDESLRKKCETRLQAIQAKSAK